MKAISNGVYITKQLNYVSANLIKTTKIEYKKYLEIFYTFPINYS